MTATVGKSLRRRGAASMSPPPVQPEWWNVIATTGTDLPPHLLLSAKLLAFCTILVGLPLKLPEPFVPLLALLDHFRGALTPWILQAVYGIGLMLLFTNRSPRAGCVLLGGVLLFGVASSPVFYSNGKFYVACAFLCLGLDGDSGRPHLLRYQLSLIYLGAAVNKLFDPDWRSGQFFEFWMLSEQRPPIYVWGAGLLPQGWYSWLMSWFVISFELVFGIAILARAPAVWLIWCGVLFHAGSMVLADSMFGEFVPAVLCSYLVFVRFPERVRATRGVTGTIARRLAALSEAVDWDDRWHWEKAPAARWPGFTLETANRNWTGIDAARGYLLLHPGFYFVFAFFFICPKMSESYRDVLFTSALVFFSPPGTLLAYLLVRGKGMEAGTESGTGTATSRPSAVGGQ